MMRAYGPWSASESLIACACLWGQGVVGGGRGLWLVSNECVGVETRGRDE